MSDNYELAANCWEVERHACGPIMRPFCALILRNKKECGKSIVKATSSDFQAINDYAKQMTEDLYIMSNDEFVERYNLSGCS